MRSVYCVSFWRRGRSKKRSKRRFVKIVLVFRNNFTSARAREHTYTRFHKKRDRFASPQKRTRRYLLNGFRERLVTLCVRIIVAFFLVLKLESLFPRQQRVVFGRLQRYLKRHSEIWLARNTRTRDEDLIETIEEYRALCILSYLYLLTVLVFLLLRETTDTNKEHARRLFVQISSFKRVDERHPS